ncbi:MAG: PqqD family protein [Acidimicrobiia bacterium]
MAGSNDDDASRWERDEQVLWRSGPGFVVLLCPRSATPVLLRGTGVELWAAFDRPRSVPEIAARLSMAFGAEYEPVRSDVAPVVARLAETGALRPVP